MPVAYGKQIYAAKKILPLTGKVVPMFDYPDGIALVA